MKLFKMISSNCFPLLGLLDNVTVLIGIAHGGKAIAGVINQPFYNYQVNPISSRLQSETPDNPECLLSLVQEQT